jgi:hypothetical protein
MNLVEKFYQNFEMTEELFVLLLVPMLPKNEILSAKDHPIINKKWFQITEDLSTNKYHMFFYEKLHSSNSKFAYTITKIFAD